ncbi:hypothetical protein KFE25_011614 [Diacronema lutheri]|uniref:Glycosyltransferase family 92 protein n=2 Tax=Diacronema lutheri TaxID=2081491 RepID=A0A8J5XD32_DIALT|nr:hypothetical protein KFE25_011614 [Diacronema lutheri]
MAAQLAALLACAQAVPPRVVRWGEPAAELGDFAAFAAYRVHGNRTVAIVGLARGSAEAVWQQRRAWPRCAFPDGSSGYARAVRADVFVDTESRVANARIALHTAVALFCDAPDGGALAPDAPAHVRLALGDGEAVDVPYMQPRAEPPVHLAVCTRVFGDSVHVRLLREWLAHHRAAGAGRFVLHDHGDAAGRWGDARADLRAALAAGGPGDGAGGGGGGSVASAAASADVEVVPMIGSYRTWAYHQKLAYYDCLLRVHAGARWALMIDLDEAAWVRGQTLGALLGALPAHTSAVVLQFADVLTFACHPDTKRPLLERMAYVRTPSPTRMPRKNCVGGKYAIRPRAHVRTPLNTHAPKNRTRPFCVMPVLTSARINHYHQLEHSGVMSERATPWRAARYCEEAENYAPTDAPTWRLRYVRVGPDGAHPMLGGGGGDGDKQGMVVFEPDPDGRTRGL